MLSGACLAIAQTEREPLGALRWPIDQSEYEREVTALRAILGEEVFAASRKPGRMCSLEQAYVTNET
jgi:hypothetical protein